MIINSLAPGKFEWNFRQVIFKQILVIVGWGISSETALIWMSLDFTDDQSTLVQVMAWCHQATSHYLSQYWPKSLLPYGVTRPQWVNSLAPSGTKELGQHWFRWWLVAWWHQAIIWTNVDISSVKFWGIHFKTISLQCLWYQSVECVAKFRIKIVVISLRGQWVKLCMCYRIFLFVVW